MKQRVGDKSIHLTYSTNVHPSENLTLVKAFLNGEVLDLKRRICPDGPFGLGLHLSNSVVEELTENEYRRWELDAYFEKHAVYPFTLNCFPYGDFHGEVVKEKVFEPDWTDLRRLEYTKKAADLLARWLPEGVSGSISTHSGAYGKREGADPRRQWIADQLAKAALHFSRLEDKTGRRIVLSLEPEPCAIVDRSGELVAFYQDEILRAGMHFLGSRWKMPRGPAEELLRRHLGVCFDTCHASVLGEKPLEALGRFRDAGISVGKIQISVALRVDAPGEAAKRARIACFAEPRYFHQTALRFEEASSPDRLFVDLGHALESAEFARAAELRSHFHLPVFWEGDGVLATTRPDIEGVFAEMAAFTDHFEIETYTWDVIPEAERAALAPDLVSSLEKEFRWVRGELRTA